MGIWTPPAGRGAPLNDHDFASFKTLCEIQVDDAAFPLADSITQRICVYSASKLRPLVRGTPAERDTLLDEIQRALSVGPGIVVVRGLVDKAVVDRAVEVTEALEREQPSPPTGGSSRTFAFGQKYALYDPESYAAYFGNDVLAAVAEAWLGPGYQITAATNSVMTGNIQDIHRDYPLAAEPADRIARYPLINQIASQLSILQGAIAHTDMPLECGPTRFAPFTQQFQKGYMACKLSEYTDWVKPRMSQLPLSKGDGVFFNPACFHHPGNNTTDRPRVANLVQISASWSTPMEAVDRLEVSKHLWPVIRSWATSVDSGASDAKHPLELEALIDATCDNFGYPMKFDHPDAKMGDTQGKLVRAALQLGWSDADVKAALDGHAEWHRPFW